MRLLGAVVLSLWMGTTLAIPVTTTGAAYSWWTENHVGAGTVESLNLGDAIGQSPNSAFSYDLIETSEYGSSRAWTYGHVDQSQIGTDDVLFYQLDVHVNAFASVDASVPQGSLGFAHAALRIWLMAVQFEVTETVLFAGTGPLYGPGTPLFNTGAPTIDSGTYLQPGRYTSFFVRDLEAQTPHVQPGQTVSISNTFSNTYGFTRVPVPATLPLLGLGMLAIVWSRQRRK